MKTRSKHAKQRKQATRSRTTHDGKTTIGWRAGHPILRLPLIIGNQRFLAILQSGKLKQVRDSGRRKTGAGSFDGPRIIRELGGRVHAGTSVDATLRIAGARAATLGHDVYLRSDVAVSPDAPRNRRTYAHEAIHLLQQRDATACPTGPRGGDRIAEREADAGAKALLAGHIPQVGHSDTQAVLRFEPDFNKEFGPPLPFTLEEARADPLWVEFNIYNYFMETLESPEILIIYEDGNILRIPIKYVFFKPLAGGTVNLFRRHKTTGRLISFSISTTSLMAAARGRETEAAAAVVTELVPPRFDPKLAPLIAQYVDAELMRHAAIGFLQVAKLHVGGALVKQAIATRGLFTVPRVTAGAITAGVNLLDQALEYGANWEKYNWESVGFDFAFGMMTQALVAKLFQKWPAPIFSKKILSLQTWKNFAYQQTIFLSYGTMVGLVRSQVGHTEPSRTVASQYFEGGFQAAKSGAMDSFLKSQFGMKHFPAGKNDIRIIFISKLLGLVIKAAVRQGLDVTPRKESTARE